LWTELSNHRFAIYFKMPIRDSEAPDYSSLIKRPMDLRTLRQRIRDELINTTDDLHRDIVLMYQNALVYNEPGTDVYEIA
ncbi:Bromodomain-containing protein, partial [Ramicandelaber brevisporus]